MKNGNHFIISIHDEKNRLLDFERISLKTAKGSYNHFINFIKSYGLENYKNNFNFGSVATTLKMQHISFEPYNEKTVFVKSFDEFLTDLNA